MEKVNLENMKLSKELLRKIDKNRDNTYLLDQKIQSFHYQSRNKEEKYKM